MSLVIPGVEVNILKEVVPSQLAPTGVLGIIGVTESGHALGSVRVASWNSFIEKFGAASAHSMPQVKKALENGVNELVICPLNADTASASASASADSALVGLDDQTAETVATLTFTTKFGGTWGNDLCLKISGSFEKFDLKVLRAGDLIETHRNLNAINIKSKLSGDDNISKVITCSDVINSASVKKLTIKSEAATSLIIGTTAACKIKVSGASNEKKVVLSGNPTELIVAIDGEELKEALNLIKDSNNYIHGKSVTVNDHTYTFTVTDYKLIFPVFNDEPITFTGGSDPLPATYKNAIALLEEEDDVDMIMAAVQIETNNDLACEINQSILSHCNNMAEKSKGRIAFAQLDPGLAPDIAAKIAESLNSDRMVVVASKGQDAAAIVAGRTASLKYYEAPTFKNVGISIPEKDYLIEDQTALLKGGILPVVSKRGRGNIILKGICTDGQPISVTRIADYASRGVKNIAELFIGLLNTDDARDSLQQKIAEFLEQMKKDHAIVPSTDGTQPAYKLNVYSSQQDFSQGIVRIDMAVRPVRSIDYIYANLLIEV